MNGWHTRNRPAPVKVLLVVLPLFLILGTAHAQVTETSDVDSMRIGVSVRSFATISRNDASAALKAWATTVAKEQDLKIVPQVVLYDSVGSLRTDILGEKLDAIAITTEELMLIGVRPDSVFLPAPAKGFFVRYSVWFVATAGSAVILPGLAGRKVGLDPDSMDGHGPAVAGDGIGRRAERAGERADLVMTENPSKAILQVFFRQTDAALVTVDAFDLTCELNPQLRRDLVVLTSSPPFITAFLIFPDPATDSGKSSKRPSWTCI